MKQYRAYCIDCDLTFIEPNESALMTALAKHGTNNDHRFMRMSDIEQY